MSHGLHNPFGQAHIIPICIPIVIFSAIFAPLIEATKVLLYRCDPTNTSATTLLRTFETSDGCLFPKKSCEMSSLEEKHAQQMQGLKKRVPVLLAALLFLEGVKKRKKEIT